MTAAIDHEDDAGIIGLPWISKAEIVYISVVKHLLAGVLPTDYRLQFLVWLDRRTRPSECSWQTLRITPEVVAAIEPICQSGSELLREIMKLDALNRTDAIARNDTFRAFVALNPSLLSAIRTGSNQERRAS